MGNYYWNLLSLANVMKIDQIGKISTICQYSWFVVSIKITIRHTCISISFVLICSINELIFCLYFTLFSTSHVIQSLSWKLCLIRSFFAFNENSYTVEIFVRVRHLYFNSWWLAHIIPKSILRHESNNSVHR